jgi:acyl carrier protein
VDDQVKIRGFRIEPNEVATTLRAHPAVRESVVLVAGEGAQRHLVAYVTPAEGVDRDTLRPSMLRDFLANRLPEYLVPTGFRAVDRLPLNANGKVDRAALPAPDRVRETTGPATPPRGATEERLAEAWRLLLPAGGPHGGDIGREDAFFALGGNSLLAARLMFRIREAFDVELPMAAFYAAPTLAACAAAIDQARSANRIAVGGQRPAAAPSAISRRDRSAFRVPGQRPARDEQPGPAMAATGTKAPTGLPPHLTRLTDDWALWRTVCLRAPGFPVHLLADLGDESLAGAADAVIAADPHARDRAGAAYDAEFPAALGRMSAALHRAANQPALREAVAWQNRHALTTGIDVLLRRGPAPARRNTQTRQHEALVASYVQRYCAKNDTIGFFGPVGWSRIDDDSGIRITHATAGHRLAARVTYLEGWAVQAIMAEHASALRPWLVPRRMPFVSVDGALLRVPLAPAVALSPAEAAVMRASDGIRDANAVAAAVLADPSAGLSEVEEVFAVLGRLADSHRLAWQIDVAPQDIRPEQSMRATLSPVTHHDGIREPAEGRWTSWLPLGTTWPTLVAMPSGWLRLAASLEATFTGLAGIPPTRRAGGFYAGRTLAFEVPTRRHRAAGRGHPGRHPRGPGDGTRRRTMVHRGVRRDIRAALRRGLPRAGRRAR